MVTGAEKVVLIAGGELRDGAEGVVLCGGAEWGVCCRVVVVLR